MAEEGKAVARDKGSRALRLLVATCWLGVAAWAVLAYLAAILLPALDNARRLGWDAGSAIALVQAVIGLAVLLALLLLLREGWRVLREGAVGAPAAATPRTQFPAPITLTVGAWVLAFTALSLAALLLLLRCYDGGKLEAALLTMFAAGVGSSIATILGFLKHASEEKDFDAAYAAWYVGRPLLGLLLGLLFYFVIEGGLVAVLPSDADRRLNEFGLVAIGGMVGLFSKNAVEKLREIFNVLFATREQVTRELLDRLPPELAAQVEPYLANKAAAPPTAPPPSA